ncbi:unnamed protein product, partial [Ixodes pacificus]
PYWSANARKSREHFRSSSRSGLRPTCATTRPHFWSSSRVAVATEPAMAGGGAVRRQAHAWTSCPCARTVSQRRRTYSAWNCSEWPGVVAAFR